MKLIFAVLFLCSVAFSQDATVSQSSQPTTVGSATFNTQAYRPQSFVIYDGTKNIVTISTETGEVKYGEGVTMTEASRKFYEEVGKLFGNTLCPTKANAQPTASGGVQVWDSAADDLGKVYIPNQAAKKPKVGAKPATSGKPDSEKTKK